MLAITKEFSFEAAHWLPDYDGVCQNLHGHSYRLQVEVCDVIISDGPKKGMILDFSDLKRVVNEQVIGKLDHQCLNDLEYSFSLTPTAENLVVWIVEELRFVLPGLIRVRLWETLTSYCEWKK